MAGEECVVIRRTSFYIGFMVLSCVLFQTNWAEAKDYTTGDPRRKQVEDQLKQNKDWKKSAEKKQKDYYSKAKRYLSQKRFSKAEEYFKRAENYKYKQWQMRKVSGGSKTTYEPAVRKRSYRLWNKYAEMSQEALEVLPDKVAAEKAKATEGTIRQLLEKAEAADLLQNFSKAYDLYDDVIKKTSRYRDSKKMVRHLLNAQKKQLAILKKIAKPLDDAEKLLKEGKAAEAREVLAAYKEKNGKFLKAEPDLKKRFDALFDTPAIAEENREAEVRRKILAGDAALRRKDYLTAEKYYREATRLHLDTEARQKATDKLAAMLADEEIVAAMKQQQLDRECQPLLARAKYLLRLDEFDGVKKLCDRIIKDYPDSEYANQAQELLDGMKK
jgi:tetratricopeptide (TPR) repeat protein